MIVSFKKYLQESNRTIYFTFGRMNPPTRGHEKLIETLSKLAEKNDFRIYLSQTHDNKKNPLLYEEKIKIARKIFPKYGRQIYEDKTVRDPLQALSKFYEEGYRNVVMVVGSDRVEEFQERFNLYNGVRTKQGYYAFDSIQVVSAGTRDPDAEGVSGVSSSKLRESAFENNFIAFSQGLPKHVSTSEAKQIYNRVRLGLGLKEEKKPKAAVSIEPISETREKYIKGELFDIGDQVVIKQTEQVGTVKVLGSNYVIVEMAEGGRFRKWLNDVEKL